ncbi:hypothetical protein H8B15_16705 [Hymenobacter sp. BT507]|uniref:DUF2029 domain-containing protein n=1 Tax=Hymenobacter citatus TaxID=2763506 RepID=A0ABR7MPC4_9BACT|nr:hypothetical protein [Hymenobacter citatus]
MPTTWRNWLLVYIVAVGLLAGGAYTMYRHYDFSHSLDTRSYLRVAQGKFRGTSITRRYRVVVPWAAAAVAWPIKKVYTRVWPQRPQSEWPLRLAFYIVNTLVLAGAGLLMFRTCLLYGASPPAALLALAAVLCSRWAVYLAGLPMVDSLYVLVVALAFYAARSGSRAALVCCLLLGPLAKESFVFLVPWLLVFGQTAGRWPLQLMLLTAAGALTYTIRYWIDAQAGTPPAASVQNAFHHFENLRYSLQRLFSVGGAGDLFSVLGFFWLLFLLGLCDAALWRRWIAPLGWAGGTFLLLVLVHMLLSGELGRMAYLGTPVLAVGLALVLTHHPLGRWLINVQHNP